MFWNHNSLLSEEENCYVLILTDNVFLTCSTTFPTAAFLSEYFRTCWFHLELHKHKRDTGVMAFFHQFLSQQIQKTLCFIRFIASEKLASTFQVKTQSLLNQKS